ncbi:MAG: hypothetical protein HYU56_03185 [Candidatus Aenigmarchaeota archaeon]|nr:hypothetical protein [Candidatus Aenigmarchaeota archaeon]
MPLDRAEKFLFELGMDHPWIFRHLVRRELYRRNRGDPEAVHEYTLNLLNDPDVLGILRSRHHADFFKAPEDIMITLNGKRMSPFGTAAGMDKNGDALEAFSCVFGFQETGTIVVPEREGNRKPRVAADARTEDIYNAQGFPSKGLVYAREALEAFRHRMGPRPAVYANICGLPLSDEKAVETAMEEMKTLLVHLGPYVDGFVWNPASPNTKALMMLRRPHVARQTSELMRKYAHGMPRLMKVVPYEDSAAARDAYLHFVGNFMAGGGHGVVAVNTKSFPKDQVPVDGWGYDSAGRSGRFLKPYMLRAVRDTRREFPEAVIVGTGGISGGDDAYDAFKAGATMLEGFSPYTYYGLGLLPRIQRRLHERLEREHITLHEIQYEARRGRDLII